MNIKVIVACAVIVAAVVFGAMSFVETNVEYADFGEAANTGKKVQVKGTWIPDRETTFDTERSVFSFYMVDDNGRIEHVMYEGARPNNFEIADAIVVKGTYAEGTFHAENILTKCPSKYEGDASAVEKTL